MTTPLEPFGFFRSTPFGWEDCAETDEGAKALYEITPDQALEALGWFSRLEIAQERLDRAERALISADWTYIEGAAEWKPPIGPSASPLLDRITELERQRAVLVDVIKQYLSKNDPEGFGCACTPERKCGPCRAYDSQQPLRAALAAVKPAEGSDCPRCAGTIMHGGNIAAFKSCRECNPMAVKPTGQEGGAS